MAETGDTRESFWVSGWGNGEQLFLFPVVLGLKLRASLLLGKHDATRATPPACFVCGVFQDKIS
jgi:hypothetical protein